MVNDLRNPVPYTVRQLPVIGNLSARVGQVVSILGTPCNPTPEIIVLAAFKAAPKLFWSLYKPDALDKYFERFGTGHHKKRQKRFKVMDHMTGRQVGTQDGMTWVAFRGAQLAQRIGWYFIVADATTEFAVNWTSTVYEWGGCEVPGTPYAEARAVDTYNIYDAGVNTTWTADFNAHPPFSAGHGWVSSPFGYDSACSASFQWKSEAATGLPKGTVDSVELYDSFNDASSGPIQMREGPDGSVVAYHQYRNWAFLNVARRFQWRFTVSERCWINFDGTNLSLAGHKDKGILADP